MQRITNAVLAEKIDNLAGQFKVLKTDVKANSEFRIQVKGFMAAITMFAGMLGGLIAWGMNKLFPN